MKRLYELVIKFMIRYLNAIKKVIDDLYTWRNRSSHPIFTGTITIIVAILFIIVLLLTLVLTLVIVSPFALTQLFGRLRNEGKRKKANDNDYTLKVQEKEE